MLESEKARVVVEGRVTQRSGLRPEQEQPVGLSKTEGERVVAYRGCRRRACFTPRLETVEAFGLRGRCGVKGLKWIDTRDES